MCMTTTLFVIEAMEIFVFNLDETKKKFFDYDPALTFTYFCNDSSESKDCVMNNSSCEFCVFA